jgi:hypothetical protein
VRVEESKATPLGSLKVADVPTPLTLLELPLPARVETAKLAAMLRMRLFFQSAT